MKLLFFISLALMYFCCNGQQPKTKTATTKSNTASEGATIKELKVGDYKFPIVYLTDKAKTEKINSYIINAVLGDGFNTSNLKAKLEQLKLETEKNRQGLANLNYKIIVNNNSIISIAIESEYYMSTNFEDVQYSFDLKTGYSFGIEQVILPSKKNEIKNLIVPEFKKRINQSKIDLKENGDWVSDYDKSIRDEISRIEYDYEPTKFKISEKGISFIYESMPFAMAVGYAFPNPDYFFSWDILKPYLIHSSPISSIVK